MPLSPWPAGLPADPMAQGYDEAFGDNVLRTAMEVGPPKKRPRSTAAVKPLRVTFDLSRTQVASLQAFYEATLGQGALNFAWTHPRTGAAIEVGFRTPPQIRIAPGSHGERWDAVCELEVYP